jgi:hypothetical protein
LAVDDARAGVDLSVRRSSGTSATKAPSGLLVADRRLRWRALVAGGGRGDFSLTPRASRRVRSRHCSWRRIRIHWMSLISPSTRAGGRASTGRQRHRGRARAA